MEKVIFSLTQKEIIDLAKKGRDASTRAAEIYQSIPDINRIAKKIRESKHVNLGYLKRIYQYKSWYPQSELFRKLLAELVMIQRSRISAKNGLEIKIKEMRILREITGEDN